METSTSHTAVRSYLIAQVPDLTHCETYHSNSDLVVSTSDMEVLDRLLENVDSLIELARGMDKDLLIRCGDYTGRWQARRKILLPPGLPPPPPLIHELPDPNRSIGIVRMDNNRAIYTTSHLDRAAKANCQIGVDLARLHLPEELHRLRSALEQHGYIEGFEYRAFNYDRELLINVVNAWLVPSYRGVPVRVVELLQQRPC